MRKIIWFVAIAAIISTSAAAEPDSSTGYLDSSDSVVDDGAKPRLVYEEEPGSPSAASQLDVTLLRAQVDRDGRLQWLEIDPERTVLRAGDRLRFVVRPGTDGYLTVYNIDVNGQRSVLIPNENVADGSHQVSAAESYTIPGRGRSSFRLTGRAEMHRPTGVERLDFYVRRDQGKADSKVYYDSGDEGDQVVEPGFQHRRLLLKVRR